MKKRSTPNNAFVACHHGKKSRRKKLIISGKTSNFPFEDALHCKTQNIFNGLFSLHNFRASFDRPAMLSTATLDISYN
jgi:hypothetical protein